jgi:hypothetical protein
MESLLGWSKYQVHSALDILMTEGRVTNTGVRKDSLALALYAPADLSKVLVSGR